MDLTDFDQKIPPKKPEKPKSDTRKYTSEDAIAEVRANIKQTLDANKSNERVEVQTRSLEELRFWMRSPAVGEWGTSVSMKDGMLVQYFTTDKPVVEPLGSDTVLVRASTFETIIALNQVSMLSIEQGREEAE